MKKFFKTLWKIIKNKYVAATLIFLIFFLFLGENNLMVTHRLKRELKELDRESDMIEKDLHHDSLEAVSLISDPDAIEAYGREHYYMRRNNEDIFIVKQE